MPQKRGASPFSRSFSLRRSWDGSSGAAAAAGRRADRLDEPARPRRPTVDARGIQQARLGPRLVGQKRRRQSRQDGTGQHGVWGEQGCEIIAIDDLAGADGLPWPVLGAMEQGDKQLAALGVHQGTSMIDVVRQLLDQHAEGIERDQASLGGIGERLGGRDGDAQTGERAGSVGDRDQLDAARAPIGLLQQRGHGGCQRLRRAAVRGQHRFTHHMVLFEQGDGALLRGCLEGQNAQLRSSSSKGRPRRFSGLSGVAGRTDARGTTLALVRMVMRRSESGSQAPLWRGTIPCQQIPTARPCTSYCTVLDFRSRLFGLYLRQHVAVFLESSAERLVEALGRKGSRS